MTHGWRNPEEGGMRRDPEEMHLTLAHSAAPAEDVPPEPASLELDPHERAEASYVSWRVHRALEDLPRNERDVVELAYYGGLSQSEGAEFLGVPLGTVKTRTRAALGRLAGMLEGEFA